mgnify:CR=1 FL=1|tara:strand:- start:683 stop:1036 length:354 start_codon:yes stop_codon:yes gene_type:complete
MGDLIHHLIHFIMYSLVLWQFVLGVYVILLWAKRNIKFNNSPVINVSETIDTKGFDYPMEVMKSRLDGKKMSNEPIEVDVKRNLIVDTKSDEVSVKLDEKIKGKVKTQKDKLRSLRK